MKVAIIGMGFGRAFAPIYRAHPLVEQVTLADPNEIALREALKENPGAKAATFDQILADPEIDAVHVATPLPLHVEQTLQILNAGKHCACAVTMGQSLEELRQVVEKVHETGLSYMMMETGIYTREFLFAKDLVDSGQLGEISHLRGDYFQDLEAPYPDYWRRVPPMHYATHIVAPILALAKSRAAKVACIGGGRLRPDISTAPQSPFPLQSAIIRLEGSDAAVQLTRAWYQTAHEYVESFSAYGDKMGFEWQQLERENPVVYRLAPVQNEHRWRHCQADRTPVPFRPDLLPEELGPFADGGHGGSHAHLVHEFLSSVEEGRRPAADAQTSAHWCAVGICAHESSLRDGEWVSVPSFA